MIDCGTLWLGPAGTGKTTALIEALRRVGSRKSQPVVIVGRLGEEARERLGERVMGNARELTLGELAQEILQQHGTHIALMTPAQRGVLIWKAAKDSEIAMDTLQANIGAAKGGRAPKAIRNKRAEKALRFYEQQKTHRNLFDEMDVLRELLWRLKEQIRQDSMDLTLVVDGYESLMPIEHETVKALIRRGARVLATADPSMAYHPTQPCVGTNGIRQLAAFNGVRKVTMDKPYRFGATGVRALNLVLSEDEAPERIRCAWKPEEESEGIEVSATLFDSQEEEIATICEVAKKGAPFAVVSSSIETLNRIEEAFLANFVRYERHSGSTIHGVAWRLVVDLLEALRQGKEEYFRALIAKSSFDRRSWRRLSKEEELPADPAVAIVKETQRVRQIDHEAAVLADMLERFRGDRFCSKLANAVCEWTEACFGDPRDVAPIRMRCSLYVNDEWGIGTIVEDVHDMLHKAASIESGESSLKGQGVVPVILTPHESSMFDLDHVWVPAVGFGVKLSSRKAWMEERMLLYRAISRASSSVIITSSEGCSEEELISQIQHLAEEYACSA